MIAEKPLYVLASLWVHQGQVANFEAYESHVVRILKRCGGIVERAIRTTDVEGGSSGRWRNARTRRATSAGDAQNRDLHWT